MTNAVATAYELNSRTGDGLDVRLMWRAHDDYLFVTVADHKKRQGFSIEVLDHARALDVFHHPFAYDATFTAMLLQAPPEPMVGDVASRLMAGLTYYN